MEGRLYKISWWENKISIEYSDDIYVLDERFNVNIVCNLIK